MSRTKSRLRSAAVTTPDLLGFKKQKLQILAPIYDKVELLRQQMQAKHEIKHASRQQIYLNSYKTQQIFMPLDRGNSIQKIRQIFQSTRCSSSSNVKDLKSTKNKIDQSAQNRNRAKSLINFLVSHSDKNKIQKENKVQTNQSRKNTQIQTDYVRQRDDRFQPMGEEYKKEKYLQSIRSQTQSLSSSRNESSLQSSKIGLHKKQSRKYLRKGTRVREILLRQLQTPDERTSTPSTMTYLKDYDQWVPTSLVEEKKEQLQSFMNIIYGNKKVKIGEDVDLQKINIIYL